MSKLLQEKWSALGTEAWPKVHLRLNEILTTDEKIQLVKDGVDLYQNGKRNRLDPRLNIGFEQLLLDLAEVSTSAPVTITTEVSGSTSSRTKSNTNTSAVNTEDILYLRFFVLYVVNLPLLARFIKY